MGVADGVWSIEDPYTQDMLERANVILTTAVLSIMMTAPVFAVLMAYTGPRWLEQDAQIWVVVQLGLLLLVQEVMNRVSQSKLTKFVFAPFVNLWKFQAPSPRVRLQACRVLPVCSSFIIIFRYSVLILGDISSPIIHFFLDSFRSASRE